MRKSVKSDGCVDDAWPLSGAGEGSQASWLQATLGTFPRHVWKKEEESTQQVARV